MATYILRAFDVKLASTGFKCAMLTGSYAVGDRIEYPPTENKTKDAQNIILGIDVPTVDSSKVTTLTLSGTSYRFGSDGMCITDGFYNYRLMLTGVDDGGSEVGSLNKIYEILSTINDTLEQYTKRVDKRLSDLEDDVEGIEDSIDDLDDRVTALENK